MEKSPDAFRTISEVAEWLDVPTHVLRFWESRFAQVKPVKRAGGRRYYRPSDMRLIGGIKKLLYDDGMTIRGVQKLLREEGIKHVSSFSPPLDSEVDADVVIDLGARKPQVDSAALDDDDAVVAFVRDITRQPDPEPEVEIEDAQLIEDVEPEEEPPAPVFQFGTSRRDPELPFDPPSADAPADPAAAPEDDTTPKDKPEPGEETQTTPEPLVAEGVADTDPEDDDPDVPAQPSRAARLWTVPTGVLASRADTLRGIRDDLSALRGRG
jgi:DNA-binding transcriptional MerR regulator